MVRIGFDIYAHNPCIFVVIYSAHVKQVTHELIFSLSRGLMLSLSLSINKNCWINVETWNKRLPRRREFTSPSLFAPLNDPARRGFAPEPCKNNAQRFEARFHDIIKYDESTFFSFNTVFIIIFAAYLSYFV